MRPLKYLILMVRLMMRVTCKNQCNQRQTCASVDVTECMAENQDRADGWSGHRSTTVCLASGECSSSCLEEKIRKVQTALTSLLSLKGSKTFVVHNLIPFCILKMYCQPYQADPI